MRMRDATIWEETIWEETWLEDEPPRDTAWGRAGRLGYGVHDRAARAAAIDDGLLSEEVEEVLGGRRIVDAFPVRLGETPPAYAVRAVAEMMVAYLR